MEISKLNIIEVSKIKKNDIKFSVKNSDVIKILTLVDNLNINIKINIKRTDEVTSEITLRVHRQHTDRVIEIWNNN